MKGTWLSLGKPCPSGYDSRQGQTGTDPPAHPGAKQLPQGQSWGVFLGGTISKSMGQSSQWVPPAETHGPG